MKTFTTDAIVLKRVNYGEADRVVTFLTPDRGQVSAMAKGVRRAKSKLAGGIELLSVCTITFMQGKGDLDIVRSSRLKEHYAEILKDYDRLQFAYEAIDLAEKMTADVADEGIYEVLQHTMETLNNPDIDLHVVRVWFHLHCLRAIGQLVNLEEDSDHKALKEDEVYELDKKMGVLILAERGKYTADEIRLLRLLLKTKPEVSRQVTGAVEAAQVVVEDFSYLHKRLVTLGA